MNPNFLFIIYEIKKHLPFWQMLLQNKNKLINERFFLLLLKIPIHFLSDNHL